MSEHHNSFARLSAINVNEHIERKGGFAYLSWPFAVAQLRSVDPTATWEVRRFGGLPYLATDAGVFVEVVVTVQGITLSQIHPVLDGRNRPLLAPTAFDINTSLQRCLVKAIALHGLGLYIYAGEDLPVVIDTPAANDEAPKRQEPSPWSPDEDGVITTISRSQQAQIHRLVIELGVDMRRMLDYFGVRELADIPVEMFPRVVRSLEKKRAQAA
ncbi:DUF1071 domain-containing protein [Ottowia caeni]|uniref:Sak single strand annealing protein n=1 Tax=Ottowia caeni TaxID=2870339 RepID=UPI001E2D6E9D|nr:DUF1071 domain-containing protein [Ottowia caeni]